MKKRSHNILPEQIEIVVANWDAVEVYPHRFGGREFSLMNREFGHIHVHGIVDIPFSRKIRDQLIADGMATRHHFLPETGWVTVPVDESTELEQVLKILRFSYLLHRIKQNSDTLKAVAELETLGLSQELQQLVVPAE